MNSTWKHVRSLMRGVCPRYSMSEEAQRELFKLAWGIGAPGLIVELGVCHGKTALMLAWVAWQHGLAYLGVDTWGLEGSREQVASSFDAAGVPHRLGNSHNLNLNIELLEGNTHTVPLPEAPIDLLVVDAGHDEENVRQDCERWVPRVKPGGLVVFDDYPGTDDARHCHWAVKHYADLATQGWENILYYEGRMMVRRRPL